MNTTWVVVVKINLKNIQSCAGVETAQAVYSAGAPFTEDILNYIKYTV